MSKVAVVYWSGTGNTEAMAQLVAEGAEQAGADVSTLEVGAFSGAKLAEFDAVAFGCPAMGDEELEDMEFEPVYSDCEPHLGDRKVVLFGSYDWNNGEWMEIWNDRALAAGVNVVETVIAKDYPDDDAAAACRAAGATLA